MTPSSWVGLTFGVLAMTFGALTYRWLIPFYVAVLAVVVVWVGRNVVKNGWLISTN